MHINTLIALAILAVVSLFSFHPGLIWIAAFFIMFIIRFGTYDSTEGRIVVDRWELDEDLLMIYRQGREEKLLRVFRLPADPAMVLTGDKEAILMDHHLFFRHENAAAFFEDVRAHLVERKHAGV